MHKEPAMNPKPDVGRLIRDRRHTLFWDRSARGRHASLAVPVARRDREVSVGGHGRGGYEDGRKPMTLTEARAECERWLTYLKGQEERSIALQRLAAERRHGNCDAAEAQRRLRTIDSNVTVYDGARLADAVRVLLKLSENQ